MSTRVELRLLKVGSCRHLECLAVRGGRWRDMEFPALCGLIRHPSEGWMLFDTGYADRFFSETDRWPEKLYRTFLPVELDSSECLSTQLTAHGVTVCDIRTVIVSHYHADHVAGLRDFPSAEFIASRKDTEDCLALAGKRWRATLRGCLPALLPPDYLSRVRFVEERALCALPAWLAPFTFGYDLIGDQSVIGVPLQGHSHSQLGLFIPNAEGRPVFLVADAAWSLPALRAGHPPSRLAGLVNSSRRDYLKTFLGLHHLAMVEPDLALLPSHCKVAWSEFAIDG